MGNIITGEELNKINEMHQEWLEEEYKNFRLLSEFMKDITYKTRIKLIDDTLEGEVYYKGLTKGYFDKGLNKENYKIINADISIEEELLLIRVVKL